MPTAVPLPTTYGLRISKTNLLFNAWATPMAKRQRNNDSKKKKNSVWVFALQEQ
jgi:hypothetical protein